MGFIAHCFEQQWSCYQGLKVQLKRESWYQAVKLWWLTKVQPCDVTSHVLTATACESSLYENKFNIKLQQYRMARNCAIILPCESVVHHCLLLYKVSQIISLFFRFFAVFQPIKSCWTYKFQKFHAKSNLVKPVNADNQNRADFFLW